MHYLRPTLRGAPAPDHFLDNRSTVHIEIVGKILDIQTIARGRRIRELARLRKVYGPGRWRKLKGNARVRLPDGTIATAEVQWYEVHGLGRRELKIKRLLGDRS